MMMKRELPELLRCPVTWQRLQHAPDKLIAFLENERNAGRLLDQSGNPVAELILSGFLREDGRVFYPIRSNIPVMLFEESIPVNPAWDTVIPRAARDGMS